MESILTSVKKHIGIEKDYNHFDPEIIDGINSAFGVLAQIGVGPKTGFMIKDQHSNWDEFIEAGQLQNMVRQYVPLKVKQIFDPSSSGNVSEAVQSRIEELEWRMQTQVEILDNVVEKEGDNNE